MADIQAIYNILLSGSYQDKLFSSLQGSRKKEGREILVDCPFCDKPGHFSYSTQQPVWKCWSCGESGDWIKYLEKAKGYDFPASLQELANEAGVETSPYDQAHYQASVTKANILETAQEHFTETLKKEASTGGQVWAYLTQRGYAQGEIEGMELGAYLDRPALHAFLKSKGFTAQDIQASGLMTSGFGEDYKLTLLWRDQAGRAIGIVGRIILPEEEREKKGLPKYKYSAGLEKGLSLIGFSSCRGSRQVVLVEGVLDALYLDYKGFKVVAVGGTSLSSDQVEALELAGTKDLLLAMDTDKAGQRATENILKSLATSSLRPYVVSWPAEYKDPDELVRKAGAQAFKDAVAKAETKERWLAKRISQKYDLQTDRGLDQALEEAQEAYVSIEDKISQRAFLESLSTSTGLPQEELYSRLAGAAKKASLRRAQAVLQESLTEAQKKASRGDITGAEAGLAEALREVRTARGVETPEPYLVEDLSKDILSTSPALATGYRELDKVARIPVGALTIIAGRPGHGKTTLQLNLLVNMLKSNSDKSFYFFSYEESRKALATKLIMILAGVTLNEPTNYGAYVNYLQYNRDSNEKIERAIKEYEKLSSTGRLLISDRMYTAEDLATVIGLLARGGAAGAVIVDYIQKIPLQRPSSQRYLDIKQVSALLLEQAVTQDLPIILGAQLGRSPDRAIKVKLDNLRESGDIEQDANLVLGLFTKAVEDLEDKDQPAGYQAPGVVDIQVTVLKNRAGPAGSKYILEYNRPIMTITDKRSSSVA